MKVKQLIKVTMKFVDDNLPTILMVVAEMGLVATVASAVHDSKKATIEIDNAKLDKVDDITKNDPDTLDKFKDENGEYNIELVKLTPWEYFKALAPVYWRTALCATGTGLCIFFSHHIEHKRYLAVLGALALKEKDLEQYKSKIKELFGEKKAQEVEKELNKDVFKNIPEDNRIYYTGHGDYLCYEPLTRSYFRSSQTAVKSGINDFISKLMREGSATVTDLAFCLDIPIEDTYLDDRSGWSYEGNKGDVPEFGYEYSGHPMTGEPCMVVTCYNHPVCGLY